MTSARFLPWVMWFFPLVFFGFQFILRLFPGLVMPEFLEKYQISVKYLAATACSDRCGGGTGRQTISRHRSTARARRNAGRHYPGPIGVGVALSERAGVCVS